MMGIEIAGQIEKVNGKELSYSDFVERYISNNQPVVLTGIMNDWRACRDWVTDCGKPNLQFFSQNFGKSRVQVAECGTREFTDQKRVEMTVSEFVDKWIHESVENYANTDEAVKCDNQSVLYLKDWHFVKEYPEYKAYTTPLFFCDDWLNLNLDNYPMHTQSDAYQEKNDNVCSDYRFVYMGAKGSWTPLHADVFRSYSWSANVCGKKRWLFLSPSQCHLVYDRYMKFSVYNIFDDVSETEFPGFKKALWLECIQEEKEVIFVPSGWYHQVHNLEDTISINHNWFNAYNLSWVWNLLAKEYNAAKEYIEDIKDICDNFEELCQRNLAANAGMNFWDFFKFIERFSLTNLVVLLQLTREYGSQTTSSALAQHLALNLSYITRTALEMKGTCTPSGGIDSYLSNVLSTLEDPKFLNLSTDLGRTYGLMYKQPVVSSDFHQNLMIGLMRSNILRAYDCQVCAPENLVKFINSTANIQSYQID